jgi:type III pantothenate kinase
MDAHSLIAVDIGNARIKLGLFVPPSVDPSSELPRTALPEPARTLSLDGDAPDLHEIAAWLGADGRRLLSWWIASVHRSSTTRLIDWFCTHRPDDRITLLATGDLPLTVRLERPDMVGVDRLVDAVAANCLRAADRPAVIVDVGTAITVDWVSADGAFRGGAILPGLRMSAQAMHELTDLLPLVDVSDLAAPPPALGTTTISAMQSGLFWGTVGAIRQLIEQLTAGAADAKMLLDSPGPLAGTRPERTLGDATLAASPQVFLTGGASPVVARLLGRDVRHVPNLTLLGIALSATQQNTQRR